MKNKKARVVTGLIIASFALMVATAQARIYVGDNFVLDDTENLNEELFLVCDEAEVSGRLSNEFIGVAMSLLLDGTVKEDVLGAALNVTFKGAADNDVYLFGETVNLAGRVGGNATIGGREVVCSGFSVGKNLRLGGSKVICRGLVGGKSVIWGNDVTLGGRYDDVVVYGRTIALDPGTLVRGSFTYHSNERINLPVGVRIQGQIRWERPIEKRFRHRFLVVWLKKIVSYFALLIPCLFTWWFAPNLLARTVHLVGSRPLRCLVSGAGAIIAVTLVILVAFATILAAPFGLLASSFYLPTLYLARAFPAIYIGRKIFFRLRDSRRTWAWAILSGLLCFTLIVSIPCVGIFINLASVPLGFGALLTGRVEFYRRLRSEKIL